MVYFPEIAQKIIIEKVLYYDFDDLIDFTLTSLVKTEPENAAQELIQIDKFYIYRELWKETMVGMYKKYIPEYNYSFNWLLEATPYTFTLAKLIPSDTDYIDLAVQKGVMDKGKVKEEFPAGTALANSTESCYIGFLSIRKGFSRQFRQIVAVGLFGQGYFNLSKTW